MSLNRAKKGRGKVEKGPMWHVETTEMSFALLLLQQQCKRKLRYSGNQPICLENVAGILTFALFFNSILNTSVREYSIFNIQVIKMFSFVLTLSCISFQNHLETLNIDHDYLLD